MYIMAVSSWIRRPTLLAAACIFLVTVASNVPVQAAEKLDLVRELRARQANQIKSFGGMETLRASYSTAEQEQGIRESREFTVRLQGPIQVVTEAQEERDILTRKEYYLHESEVYALRVWRRAPAPERTTFLISESRFFFDQGAPINWSVASARIAAGAKEPDLSKAKATIVPLPQGAEKWGVQLKSRAFAIARSFRPHVGQYVFGDWDAWLLKDAPKDDAQLSEAPRGEGWLPPEGARVLPIKFSDSPEGLFRIGWGYRQGPVDWARLAFEEQGPSKVSFSTKLAEGELKPPLSEDSNFLMNAVTGEPVSDIGLYHPGERQRFNHDEILVHWSPSSRCFVVEETQKWGDEMAGVGWIKDGRCEGTFDILTPLQATAEGAVKKSGHPAAKRMRGAEESEYSFGVSKILIADDGTFEAKVIGQIPKDDAPGGSYEAIVLGTFTPGKAAAKEGEEGRSSATIKNAKVKVLPVRAE